MKLTEEKIKTETHFSEQHYRHLKKRLEEYETDAKKEYRLKQFLCKTCFYLRGGIAGQAFTTFQCKNCGKEESYPNTAVPKYCNKCAKEHHCCVKCASKL